MKNIHLVIQLIVIEAHVCDIKIDNCCPYVGPMRDNDLFSLESTKDTNKLIGSYHCISSLPDKKCLIRREQKSGAPNSEL